jgi:peptide/nickel transport system ATP-binding protein
LIASIPNIERATQGGHRLRGLLQRQELPPGCPFFPRCDYAQSSCADQQQRLENVGAEHRVACQRWSQIPPAGAANGTSLTDGTAAAPPPGELIKLQSVTLAYKTSGRLQRLFSRAPAPVVSDISLAIAPGEIFALVGESGSGKSTIARSMSGLLAPSSGRMQFRQESLQGRLKRRALDIKRQIQYVFQNPDASLNPRESIGSLLARPLRLYFHVQRGEARRRTADGLQDVQLDPSYAGRHPDQMSGGERQRVAIARALVAQPALMLCDEVLSALDVSVQASIIELLARLRRETGIAILFISHDLAVVRHLADRTGVLFAGTLVECGPTNMLFEPPFHPYTEELLLAIPAYRKRMRSIGSTAISDDRPRVQRGCVYSRRCRLHLGRICDEESPPWRETAAGHGIRCHVPLSRLLADGLIAPRGEASGGSANASQVEVLQ